LAKKPVAVATKQDGSVEVKVPVGSSYTDLPGSSPADNYPDTLDMTYYDSKRVESAPQQRREFAVETAEPNKLASLLVETY
jgi:hypothetical protein